MLRDRTKNIIDLICKMEPLAIGPVYTVSKLLFAPVPWDSGSAEHIDEDGYGDMASVYYYAREISIRLAWTAITIIAGGAVIFSFPDILVFHPIVSFSVDSTLILGLATLGFGFLQIATHIVSFVIEGLNQDERRGSLVAAALVTMPVLIVFPGSWILWAVSSIPVQSVVFVTGHLFQIRPNEKRLYDTFL